MVSNEKHRGSRVELEGRPADVPAFEPCTAHAGADPLDDEVAFEFRDGSDDDHHRAAQRAAGVDLLAEADELDVQPVELIQHIEEVSDGAGDAKPRPARRRSGCGGRRASGHRDPAGGPGPR